MTDARSKELDQIKKTTANLFAALVHTMSQADPSFQEQFLERVKELYVTTRDDTDCDDLHSLELLGWLRQNLTGYSPISGQGKPLFED